MIAGAPGSTDILPIVQTLRGPHERGKGVVIALSSRIMATPASLRIGIGVVPAWFWMPLKIEAVLEDADDRRYHADALVDWPPA